MCQSHVFPTHDRRLGPWSERRTLSTNKQTNTETKKQTNEDHNYWNTKYITKCLMGGGVRRVRGRTRVRLEEQRIGEGAGMESEMNLGFYRWQSGGWRHTSLSDPVTGWGLRLLSSVHLSVPLMSQLESADVNKCSGRRSVVRSTTIIGSGYGAL